MCIIMAPLFIATSLLALAVLAPWIGTDSSDARAEDARPPGGWWPADPGTLPRDGGGPS
jgi:hypothetical protein